MSGCQWRHQNPDYHVMMACGLLHDKIQGEEDNILVDSLASALALEILQSCTKPSTWSRIITEEKPQEFSIAMKTTIACLQYIMLYIIPTNLTKITTQIITNMCNPDLVKTWHCKSKRSMASKSCVIFLIQDWMYECITFSSKYQIFKSFHKGFMIYSLPNPVDYNSLLAVPAMQLLTAVIQVQRIPWDFTEPRGVTSDYRWVSALTQRHLSQRLHSEKNITMDNTISSWICREMFWNSIRCLMAHKVQITNC